jgi:hypothetical protein
MNKQELLQELTEKVTNGVITQQEVSDALHIETPIKTNTKQNRVLSHLSVSNMLYTLGGIIVIIGIVIFVNRIWADLFSFGRVFITLGMSFIFALFGSLLLHSKPKEMIGVIFHFIGGILMAIGVAVSIIELNLDDNFWVIASAYMIVAIFYFLLTITYKNVLLTFFSIVYSTITVYLLVNAIIGDRYMDMGSYYWVDDIYQFITIALGVIYLVLVLQFQKTWNNPLVGVLTLVGSTAILWASFTQVLESSSLLVELLYFGLLIAGGVLSIRMKSRIILVITTIFLIVHVSFITSKYFANSLGWPISLVLLGFVFIGLGYGSIQINKKYITN